MKICDFAEKTKKNLFVEKLWKYIHSIINQDRKLTNDDIMPQHT